MSDILSIRIHEGGNLEEREVIVLPKGTTVYVPGGVIARTTGPVCEINVTVGEFPDESAGELARRIVELIRKGTPPNGEEMALG